jgi:hypothetical protein
MTAIEQLLALKRILEYAKVQGFTESYFRVWVDDQLECSTYERLLNAINQVERPDPEAITFDLLLRGPDLELVDVDLEEEELAKLSAEERERILAKDDQGYYDELEKLRPRKTALRLEPGAIRFEWKWHEAPILPPELEGHFRALLLSEEQAREIYGEWY